MPSLLCIPPKHVDPPSVTGDILRYLPGVTALYVPWFWLPMLAPALVLALVLAPVLVLVPVPVPVPGVVLRRLMMVPPLSLPLLPLFP